MATTSSSTDNLFQLPLGEFTAARNAMAARLKKAGHADESSRVKALPKPSLSAWTVNQLFWRHRKPYDRLMQSGAQFRDAQAAQLAGKSADIRRALDARREALAELARLATGLLKEAAHPASPDTMRRITTTLEALSTLAGVPGSPQGGQLTDDVDPPGFESLAALVPTVGGSKGSGAAGAILPFQRKTPPKEAGKPRGAESEKDRERARKAEEAEAKAAKQRAEKTLRDAQRTAEQAEAALKKAAARLKEAERAKTALDTQLEKATAELSEARQAARRITSEAEDAAQAVADAERALERLEK